MALYWKDKNGRNWLVCDCLKRWLTAYQDEALERGYIKRSLDIYQTIGNASASAGYHRYGGNVDMAQQSTDMLRLARNMGGAAFPRDSRDGMTPHAHIALKGCPHMTAGPRAQVVSLENGRNGLVNNRADRGPRTGIKWPLRTWQQGITWARGESESPPKPVDRMDPDNYGDGKTGAHITWLGERLVLHGFGDAYDVGPGPVWGEADRANVRAFQEAQGWTGLAADGYPGPLTLELLALDPKPSAPNPPNVPEPAEFRLLNINVGADYVRGYTSRLDNIEAVRNAARASLVVTTESGNYDDGARLNREFGWGGKRGESFILHGGSVPITTAVHWDPDKYRLIDEGQFETTGSTHRYATWVKLEHEASGEKFVVGATHLVPWPIGPNMIRKYDYQRESAFGSFLKQLVGIAGGLPILAVGDLNGKRSDPYDGPGKAMAKYGFTEAKAGKAIIDRICGKGVTFVEHTILPTRGATDHETAAAAYVALNK